MHPSLAVLLASGYAGGAAGTPPADGTTAFPLLRKPYRREQLQHAVRTAFEAVQADRSVNRAG